MHLWCRFFKSILQDHGVQVQQEFQPKGYVQRPPLHGISEGVSAFQVEIPLYPHHYPPPHLRIASDFLMSAYMNPSPLWHNPDTNGLMKILAHCEWKHALMGLSKMFPRENCFNCENCEKMEGGQSSWWRITWQPVSQLSSPPIALLRHGESARFNSFSSRKNWIETWVVRPKMSILPLWLNQNVIRMISEEENKIAPWKWTIK